MNRVESARFAPVISLNSEIICVSRCLFAFVDWALAYDRRLCGGHTMVEVLDESVKYMSGRTRATSNRTVVGEMDEDED